MSTKPTKKPSRTAVSRRSAKTRRAHSVRAKEANLGVQAASVQSEEDPDRKIEQINQITDLPSSDGVLPIAALCQLNTSNDPDCLIGNRFLRRGGGGFIVGSSGSGKSVLALQFACHMAAGLDFFGMRNPNPREPKSQQPAPLRVIYMQAENDEYEVAEVLKSVTEGWKEPEQEALRRNLLTIYNWEEVGDRFLALLRRLAEKYQPDLVIVDPMLAYVNCDLRDNRKIAELFRERITPVIKGKQGYSKGFGILFVHHTPKPQRSASNKGKGTGLEMYDMLGGAEVINWARCIIKMEPDEDNPNICNLSAPKRGTRSGLQSGPKPPEPLRLQHAKPNPSQPDKFVYRWELAN